MNSSSFLLLTMILVIISLASNDVLEHMPTFAARAMTLAYAAEMDSKVQRTLKSERADVICEGNYYFKVMSTGKPETNLPISNMDCDIINGTLLFDGYVNSVERFLPKSILSLRKIRGTIEIARSKQFPPLDVLEDVDYLIINNNEFKRNWIVKSLEFIRKGLSIKDNENVILTLPNLIDLGELQIETSAIQWLDMAKVDKCQSISIIGSKLTSLNGLRNIKKIEGDLSFERTMITSLDMDDLVSIEGNLIFVAPQPKPIAIIFPNGIDIGGDMKVNSAVASNIDFRILKGWTRIRGSVIVQDNFNGALSFVGLNPVNVENSIIFEGNNNVKIELFDVSKILKQNGAIVFRNNYNFNHPIFEGLEFIGGDFSLPTTIKDTDIKIPGYPKLKHVNGTLIIQNCQSISDTRIVQTFEYIRSLSIILNGNLNSLSGLEKITSLRTLSIERNNMIESLKELSNLVEINDTLSIKNNYRLQSLKGLNKVKRIGSLLIENNANLGTLRDLANVIDLSGEVVIKYNDQLASLEGLENLKQLRLLSLESNVNIKSLKALSNLEKVTGAATISYCTQLVKLEGLNNLKSVGSLYIVNNDFLESIGALSSLVELGDLVSIYGNFRLTSLEGLNKVKSAGSLYIERNNNLQSLSALTSLSDLRGDLVIRYNNKIKTLEGLGKIKKVNSLTLEGNKYLNSLKALGNLNEIVSELWISFNSQLGNLDGLNNVKRIGGISIILNYNLRSLSGLSGIVELNGSITIASNFKLASLQGLEKIKQVHSISINDNRSLTSLKGLNGVEKIEGEVWVYRNYLLSSFEGLNNVQEVGSLYIQGNQNLKSLKALINLVNIQGTFTLYNNNKLITLDGLDKVQHIGIIDIEGNKNLDNVSALSELNKVESLVFNFKDQTKIKEIKLGKPDSDLGKPKVSLINYNLARFLSVADLKKFLTPICKDLKVLPAEMKCNE